MRSIRGIATLVASIGILVALAGCDESTESEVIPIGVAASLTLRDAPFGEQMQQGADLAVADINEAGGVFGRKLKVVYGNDACDAKQAATVARKMIADGVPLVIGHFCSDASVEAAKVYGDADLVMISPASTIPALTDNRAGPNIYRLCGRDDQQGPVAGKYIADHFAGKDVAIVHDETTYGKSLAELTRRAMRKAGLQEKLYETITANEKNYSALVSKLKSHAIDLVFLGGYNSEAALIVRQMRDQGLDTILMGGDALVSQEFWSISGKAGEGTLMTFAPDPRDNPAARDVVERLEAKGIEPEGYVLYTYAAIQAWAEAVEKAGTISSAEVTKALNDNTFDTVIGKFRFDGKGDPDLRPYAVYRWSEGRYAEVDKASGKTLSRPGNADKKGPIVHPIEAERPGQPSGASDEAQE